MVAAAACIAVIIGLFFGWPGRPTPVDLNDLASEMPLPGIRAVTRRQAQEYFHQQGFAVTAPVDFDYQYLQAYSLAPISGHNVPRLVFNRGAYQARVYILLQGRFDLDEAALGASGAASGYKVEIRHHPTDARLVYLVIYNSDTLQPFLTDHPQEGES
jgi:hypothetical protein